MDLCLIERKCHVTSRVHVCDPFLAGDCDRVDCAREQMNRGDRRCSAGRFHLPELRFFSWREHAACMDCRLEVDAAPAGRGLALGRKAGGGLRRGHDDPSVHL